MFKKRFNQLFFACLIITGICGSAFSRASMDAKGQKQFNMMSSAEVPAYQLVGHRIGKIVLAVNNNGTIGTGFAAGDTRDAITGQSVPSCEFPKGSNVSYLFAGAFWIGAVVGRDTLVSVAADGWSYVREFAPTYANDFPTGKIIKKSTLFPDIDSLYDGAVSEEDYIMRYSDTLTEGVGLDYFGRPHIPLNIEVTQRSFAWSYEYAEDFVLFDYQIRNIGFEKLSKVYMGIYVDGDVGSLSGPNSNSRYSDDISGFRETDSVKFNTCDFVDTVNIAWLADNDGDPIAQTTFDRNSAVGVTGTRIIRTPADSLEVSFNWWVSGSPETDFGPREKAFVGKLKEDFRDLGTGGLGTPEGDVNKYYFMRNREFDYDQAFISTISSSDTLWLQPDPSLVDVWATGLDTRYLLSFGPFDINPGEKLPISFAYVAGDHFHTDPTNLQNLFDRNPVEFYRHLDFSDLSKNAAWAARVYDNPGIDTDNDGYFGKLRVCCDDSTLTYDTVSTDPLVVDTSYVYNVCDTMFYEGDGIPDFKGASPPPAPWFSLQPQGGSIRVRFNGVLSETTKDVFSRIIDFEGYRVYIARDDRASSFTMVSSYDRENYNKYVWNQNKLPSPGFELLEKPFLIDTLRCLYGDSCNDMTFNPLFYTRNNPYIDPNFPDSIFYFEPQDYNSSQFGVTTDIQKIYPNEPYPSSIIPDSAQPSELTEDGKLKYFEYELEIKNLLPTVPYYVNVTAFDFGSPESGLTALESSKSNGAKIAYAQNTSETVLANNLKVYTFPNPYRYDGNYQEDGFERISQDQVARDRIRRIHFMNLPPKCTIRIFSLDGDLIREIEHDKEATDPTSGHDEWDLITRNTQLCVSGLYYWTVESEYGETQIGKFVLIM